MTGNANSIDGIFTLALLLLGWMSKGLDDVGGSFVNVSDSLPLSTAIFERKNGVSHLASSGQSVCKNTNCAKADLSQVFPRVINMLKPILVSVASCRVTRVTLNDAVQRSIISLAKFRFCRSCNALVAITLNHTAKGLLFRNSHSRTWIRLNGQRKTRSCDRRSIDQSERLCVLGRCALGIVVDESWSCRLTDAE